MENIKFSIQFFFCSSLIIFSFVACVQQEHTPIAKLVSQKLSDSTTKIIGAPIDGKKEGMWIEYYDGRISAQRCYVNDSLSGESIDYNEDGDIFIQQTFKNGQENGMYKMYSNYKKGKIVEQGSFIDGNKVGVWEYYIDDGRLNKKVEYTNKSEKIILDNHLIPPPPNMMKPSPIDSNNRAFVTDSTGKEVAH